MSSILQCQRWRHLFLKWLKHKYGEQFSQLRGHVEEILDTNPRSITIIEIFHNSCTTIFNYFPMCVFHWVVTAITKINASSLQRAGNSIELCIPCTEHVILVQNHNSFVSIDFVWTKCCIEVTFLFLYLNLHNLGQFALPEWLTWLPLWRNISYCWSFYTFKMMAMWNNCLEIVWKNNFPAIANIIAVPLTMTTLSFTNLLIKCSVLWPTGSLFVCLKPVTSLPNINLSEK